MLFIYCQIIILVECITVTYRTNTSYCDSSQFEFSLLNVAYFMIYIIIAYVSYISLLIEDSFPFTSRIPGAFLRPLSLSRSLTHHKS